VQNVINNFKMSFSGAVIYAKKFNLFLEKKYTLWSNKRTILFFSGPRRVFFNYRQKKKKKKKNTRLTLKKLHLRQQSVTPTPQSATYNKLSRCPFDRLPNAAPLIGTYRTKSNNFTMMQGGANAFGGFT